MRNFVVIICLVFAITNSFAQTPIQTSRSTYETRRIGVNDEKLDETYRMIYTNFVKNRSTDKPIGIEVKSKNPAYKKVYLYPKSVYKVNTNPDNIHKYQYLHMARVEYAPNAENKKEAVFLFFSEKEVGLKKGIEKETILDLDKNPILLTELNTDVTTETIIGYTSEKTIINGTTTYIYDFTLLHPDKKPVVIGKLYQFKPHLQSNPYGNTTLINYAESGKMVSMVKYYQGIGGFNSTIAYVHRYDANEKLKEVRFDFTRNIKTGVGTKVEEIVVEYDSKEQLKLMSLGMDFTQNKPFFTYQALLPYDLRKKWNAQYNDKIKSGQNILDDLQNNLGIVPDLKMEQFQEFLTNFLTLPEYIIEDSEQKKTYKYWGTYNKDGIPDGWGLMIGVVPSIDEEYFLGQFKNGLPDGLGIRQNFKLDKPDTIYNSCGLHVGNTLVYGSRTITDDWGYTTTYGDYRNVSLNGDVIRLRARLRDDAYPELHVGTFEQGKLHGVGAYYSYDTKQQGDFISGDFIAGKSVTDKSNDSRYKVGAVITYMGQKRVIMKKDNGKFHLDNGKIIDATTDVSLTGEYSLRKSICNICGGTGYLQPTNKTVFSGTTKTTKTYETGPTGYILWEKTTTTSTAPVTVHKTNRCSCLSGTSGTEPVPLK